MAITNNLIVVIQNEPRDGDIVYVEKDEQHFKGPVREVIDTEWGDGDIEVGQMYYDEDNFCTLIGYEVQFPYPSTTSAWTASSNQILATKSTRLGPVW